jgi:hypothetical protein
MRLQKAWSSNIRQPMYDDPSSINIVLEPRSILGLRSQKLFLGRTSILQPGKELTEILPRLPT